MFVNDSPSTGGDVVSIATVRLFSLLRLGDHDDDELLLVDLVFRQCRVIHQYFTWKNITS